MSKITATILTLNERSHISQTLQSLKGVADEIIVIDAGSDDSTVDICKQFGCRVVIRPMTGYGAQRQYATSLASYPYVLALDADEELSPALRDSIMKLKEEGFTHRGYSFSRLNFFCGVPVKHCGWYPDIQTRLFDKRYANWNLNDVNEQVVFRENVEPHLIDGDILHYRCATIEEYLSTEMAHAEKNSRTLARKWGKISAMRPVIEGMRAFINTYLAEGGIMDSMVGLTISRIAFSATRRSYSLARSLKKEESR